MTSNSTREYPGRPIVSAHAILHRQDEVLLVKRAHPPDQGRWSVPGGVVELGETIRQAAQRELREECGIEVELGQVFDALDRIVTDDSGRVQFHYVVVYLLADYLQGEARPASDAVAVRWAKHDELAILDMHPLARKVLKNAWLATHRSEN